MNGNARALWQDADSSLARAAAEVIETGAAIKSSSACVLLLCVAVVLVAAATCRNHPKGAGAKDVV